MVAMPNMKSINPNKTALDFILRPFDLENSSEKIDDRRPGRYAYIMAYVVKAATVIYIPE